MKTVCTVIIALGAILGTGNLCATPRAGQPHIPTIHTQLTDIRLAIEIYWGKHDLKYPASLDELAQFAYKHLDLGKYPLLKEGDLIDPWGEPITYETDGQGWYIIRSSGPDKVMGTADDAIQGWPPEYVAEARQKARLTPVVVRLETNAVQAATTKTTWSFFGAKKTPSNRTPVTGGQSPTDPPEPKTTPWKLPLLLGIIAIAGAITAWRYFRKKTR